MKNTRMEGQYKTPVLNKDESKERMEEGEGEKNTQRKSKSEEMKDKEEY